MCVSYGPESLGVFKLAVAGWPGWLTKAALSLWMQGETA